MLLLFALACTPEPEPTTPEPEPRLDIEYREGYCTPERAGNPHEWSLDGAEVLRVETCRDPGGGWQCVPHTGWTIQGDVLTTLCRDTLSRVVLLVER